MNGVARGKKDMFEAFVNKDLREGNVQLLIIFKVKHKVPGTELQILLQGCIPDTEKDNILDEDEPGPEKPVKKRRTRAQRRLVIDDDDPTETSDATSIRPPDSGAISDAAGSEGGLSVEPPGKNVYRLREEIH